MQRNYIYIYKEQIYTHTDTPAFTTTVSKNSNLLLISFVCKNSHKYVKQEAPHGPLQHFRPMTGNFLWLFFLISFLLCVSFFLDNQPHGPYPQVHTATLWERYTVLSLPHSSFKLICIHPNMSTSEGRMCVRPHGEMDPQLQCKVVCVINRKGMADNRKHSRFFFFNPAN